MQFLFFANALFWVSGDNLAWRCSANSCNQFAFAAGVQGKPRCCRALKVAKETLNPIQVIAQSEMFYLYNLYAMQIPVTQLL